MNILKHYSFDQNLTRNELNIDKLKLYLKLYTNVLHMCYLPVHAAMICFLFKCFGDNLPQNRNSDIRTFYMCCYFAQITSRQPKCTAEKVEGPRR